MKLNKIIFDLDGTLMNSKKGILNSLKYAFCKMNIKEPSERILNELIGPPLLYSLLNVLNLSEKKAKRIIYFFKQRFIPLGIYENELFEGIKPMLNYLRQKKKINLYIATCKPNKFANVILNYFKINHYFKIVSASDFNNKNENKNEIISKLIKKIKNIDLKKTIMIGDRKYDIIGAKNNNILSLGVLYGYSVKNELKKEKADFLIHTVYELKKFLFEATK